MEMGNRRHLDKETARGYGGARGGCARAGYGAER